VPSLQAWPSASPAAADRQAAPGIALAATGNPHAVPLLISSAVIGLVTVIAGAAVRIHDSTQQTRRLKIQLAGSTAIAEAMARCIDDTHTAAQDVRASRGPAEAASVRASNNKVLAKMMPAVSSRSASRSPGLQGVGATSFPAGPVRCGAPQQTCPSWRSGPAETGHFRSPSAADPCAEPPNWRESLPGLRRQGQSGTADCTRSGNGWATQWPASCCCSGWDNFKGGNQ
jgi:hypothetical protein